MGLLLQIVGLILAIVSLVFSVKIFVTGVANPASVALLIIGLFLVKSGRKIYNKKSINK